MISISADSATPVRLRFALLARWLLVVSILLVTTALRVTSFADVTGLSEDSAEVGVVSHDVGRAGPEGTLLVRPTERATEVSSCSTRRLAHLPIELADDAASLAARQQVSEGATIWRTGTTGRSQAAEAQFWTLEHPSTPGFAGRHGIPTDNVANADFIESAIVRPGSPFVTRPAPGVGTNQGGGIEVVVPEGGVRMCGFSWIGPKGGC